MIVIDGSKGEGGGQILRSALALSLITGQPFRIEKIRAGRRKPGLLRQHLTGVKAAAAVGNAHVEGAELGSSRVSFHPGQIRGGEHHFAVGSAGSATLVLQTVLPALLRAPEPSTLVLEGGTHNGMSPPYDFIERAFVPLLGRMGARVEVSLERHGFYPAGGGRFTASVWPTPTLTPLELVERGAVKALSARAVVCHLPERLAHKELHIVRRDLELPAEAVTAEVLPRGPGPGNVVMIEAVCEHVTEVFSGFSSRDVTAEQVAVQATSEARAWLDAGVPVGEHLADQLLLPLAMAGGGRFRTLPPSEHTRTNIQVIRTFLDVPIAVEALDDGAVEVRVG